MAAPALLLDLDGTVIDTMGLIWQCYRDTLQERCSLEVDRSLFRRVAGLHLSEMFSMAVEEHGLPGSMVPVLVDDYRARQIFMDDHLRPFPEMEEVLLEARGSGARLAIVTTKYGAVARRHLGILGMAELFEVIVAGDDCERLKPHPEPFLRALRLLGADPERALGAGDSPHDVAAARAAGLHAGAACWGATDRDALLAIGPDSILERPADLLELLRGL